MSLQTIHSGLQEARMSDIEPSRTRGFKEQAQVIHHIVSSRLYKTEGYTSLEAYFNDKWKMSRAQVYRLMDAAFIFQVCFRPLSTSG